jgi:para-nitrobenzyl esterase
MVWLHGSPFNQGTNVGHDGAALARSGDVVVVTPAHRLGVLGFLYLDTVAPDRYPGSGVIGMLDLIASLRWVRDNIENFGGDPSNVTVFGCSGGGMKTSTLLAMPDAKGLFHRAIIESGPYVRAVPADRASDFTDRLLHRLGCDPLNVDALEHASVEQLVEAQEAVLRELEVRTVGDGGLETAGPTRFIAGVSTGGTLWDLGPVVDGVALPQHPFHPEAPPSAADVPLIVGCNRDESALWLMLYPNANGLSMPELDEIATTIHGDRGRDLMELYRRTRPSAEPQDLLDGLVSTDQMWIDLVHTAERKATGGPAPVFMYQFAYRSDAVNGRLRAAHGLEVPFVFNNVEGSKMTGARSDRFEVANAMSSAWVSFARSGDPNHLGLPEWTPYTPDDRSTMVFDASCHLAADPTELREGLDALGIEFAHQV